MPLRPDLHVHTTASDGEFDEAQIMAMARERNLNLIGITDHDTLEGVLKMQAQGMDAGLMVLPGVEISAGGDQEVHLLGYGIHSGMKPLIMLMDDMRRERMERTDKMIRRLQAMGLSIDMEDIAHVKSHSLGRAHIGRALVKKGVVDSVYEAFDKYLSPGRPGYEPKEKIQVTKVISLLRSCGAVPVIAHPGRLKFAPLVFETLLNAWKDAGLMGLEVYHPAHVNGSLPYWEALARRHRLLVTGGSDFHGADGRHMDLGAMLPYWQSAHEDAEALLDALYGSEL